MSALSRSPGRFGGPWLLLAAPLLLVAVTAALLLLVPASPVAAVPGGGPQSGQQGATGIVHSIVRAPVVPDGDVAGAPTDFVVNLDRSMDPAVPGRILLAGHQIRVTLPEAFVNTGLPGGTVFTPGCFPPNLQCNTGVMLQGWPQHPFLPMFPPGSGPPTLYTVSLDGSHTLVYTALQDVVPGLPLPGPGIKQLHLLAVGFRNPGPGIYDIEVAAQTGPGGAWETGRGRLHILPEARPSINVTSVFNAGNPNTIYQSTATGALTPLAYDFLLWGRGGVPLTGVDIEMVNPTHAVLRQGRRVVGQAFIDAPPGATGQALTAEPSFAINGPVLGVPTARLTAQFRADSAPGRYTIYFSLNGGNAIQMIVDVD